jgi:hypothetical protein
LTRSAMNRLLRAAIVLLGLLAPAYAATTSISNAHVFPTPFKPALGHDRITFTELPPAATIKVFTVSGRLVKTLVKNSATTTFVWLPVANESGASLGGGTYVFHVDSPTVRKRGRFMVIR